MGPPDTLTLLPGRCGDTAGAEGGGHTCRLTRPDLLPVCALSSASFSCGPAALHPCTQLQQHLALRLFPELGARTLRSQHPKACVWDSLKGPG